MPLGKVLNKLNPMIFRAASLSQSPSVQITPQIVKAEVNPVKPTKVNFQVSLSENPVDIYFVMDLSASMTDHQVIFHNLTKNWCPKFFYVFNKLESW